MIYKLELTPKTQADLRGYAKGGDKQKLRKIESLFEELRSHPETGTGKPECLKHEYSGLWSRRIDDKNRLIYKIEEKTVTVFVVSAKGHY